jgi:hypothetical protein
VKGLFIKTQTFYKGLGKKPAFHKTTTFAHASRQ